MIRHLLCVLALCTGPAAAGPAAWCTWQKLTALDGAAGDYFGYAVSVSGNVVVAGAWHDDDNGLDSGSAYVFRFDGSSWAQEQKLVPSDGAALDSFGLRVSVRDDVALVGAIEDDDNGPDSGSAYVYRFDGTTWVLEQKLRAADGSYGDWFGSAVSVDGNVALVGAEKDQVNDIFSGSAYVFRFNGTSWVQEQKLVASDAQAGDVFGTAVSVGGGVAVVGSKYSDGGQSDTGSAYVFRFNGTSWVQEQKVVASDGSPFDVFGDAVSVNGPVILVGAWRQDAAGFDSGAAYVYRFNGATWLQEQKLSASDGAAQDWFGWSVAVSGDLAVVGSRRDDDNGPDSGSAYVYRYDGAAWVNEAKLLAFDGSAGNDFGFTVSIDGNRAVAGAWHDNDNGPDSGSAYIFRFAQCACSHDLDGSGSVDVVDLLALLAAWGPNPGNPADFDGDGAVGIIDFLELLADWGPCA